MKKTLLILSVLLIAFQGSFAQSSESKTNEKPNIFIKGQILNASDFSEIYLDNIMNEIEVGTAKLNSDGSFKIEANISNSDFFKLRLDEYNYVILIIEPGEKIKITASTDSLFKPLIKGSPSSVLLYSTLNKVDNYDKELEEVQAKIETEKTSYIENTFKTNSNSLAGLFFINQIKDELVKESMLSSLKEKYPDNVLLNEFLNEQEAAPAGEKVPVGSIAPEIKLADPDGNEVALSSLRGKVVLIDFWASWCGPCLREAPNLVAAYEKYKDKGFEIFGVSLDAEKEAWVSAIKKFNLTWIHVSDLKYWESMSVALYGFDGIPHAVLIDKDGKVIAKNLRGAQLEEELAKIFGE